VVAKLIELFGRLDARQLLDAGKSGAFAKKREPLNNRFDDPASSGIRAQTSEKLKTAR